VASGWAAYRAGEIARADTLFRRALERCPADVAAETGLGYAALRQGLHAVARQRFARVLAANPEIVDAQVGVALVAWVTGDVETARARFRRVLELDPQNATALEYLGRMPAEPSPRPPIVLPDTLLYSSRAAGDRFEIRTDRGWQPFYVKGVNLGAALPGRFPTEFPDSATYADWIAAIAEMGANTIRLYTIHPPHFYEALRAHNLAHPEEPLRLVHGVWAELPPDHDYEHPEWEAEFFREMHQVVDLVHGRADIPPRPGHASGRYTADVSQWVLAYLIGREWEPFSVVVFNRRAPRRTAWHGRYLRVIDGNPMETWLGKACEEIVAYETEMYRRQRPVGYTNWPTLDPMYHATEATAEEEIALRRALGESLTPQTLEYDNDAVGLDALRMQPTPAFPAGVFVAFHAYPYYPDFMVLDPGYNRAESSEGRSNYFGYLRDLKASHPGMPVLIAEYGVPASLGIAHLQPQGWHHGGHTEARMAAIDARLTREIAEAGAAGGIVFAWIDEWFKKNWLAVDFEIPRERGRLWWNRLDAEQHYGMVAMEPEPAVPGASLVERLEGWRAVRPLYATQDGARLRAAADPAGLWLLFEPGRRAYRQAFIGFDMVHPRAGDFRWPGRAGPPIPVGVEFVLSITREEVRILADSASAPFRMQVMRPDLPSDRVRMPTIEDGAPAGFFARRIEQRFANRYVSVPNHDGRYDSLRVVTNRPRFGRDGTEYAGLGYERGVLPPGPPPDGFWEWDEGGGIVEVRVPWALLNVTDPSRRRVLQDDPEASGRDFGTQTVESIGLVAAAVDRRGWWNFWPAPAHPDSVARFSWPTWEEPRWRSRRRPAFEAMRRAFATLRPAVLARP
jgi:hypothetical protein